MVIDSAIDPTGSGIRYGVIINPGWGSTSYLDGKTFVDACEAHLWHHYSSISSDLEALKQYIQKEMSPETKVGIIIRMVKLGEVTIFQKLEGHDRARWELFGRRKRVNEPGILTDIENATDIDRDDVILWKQFPGDTRPGKLVYAGVVFYGEPDTKENDPEWTPRTRKKPVVTKLGQPRKLR